MSQEDIIINTVRLKTLTKYQQNVVIYKYLYNLARSVSVVISMKGRFHLIFAINEQYASFFLTEKVVNFVMNYSGI